jgi:integrase
MGKRKKRSGKRGQGEGTIHQRASDGRWVGAVSLGYENGKLRRKYFYGTTREAVADKVNDALSSLKKGLPIVSERLTLGDFLDRWLNDCVKTSVRPKTYCSYSQIARLYLKPDLGHVSLAKLSPHQVQLFLNRRYVSGGEDGKPLSARTIQYVRAVLRKALGQALKWGHVARNVALLADPPRARRPELQHFTAEQVVAFLKQIKGNRLEALYTVALAMGLREGEAFGLRWSDIDFDARILHVRVALQRLEGKAQLVETKTKESRRSLAVPDLIITGLRAHRVRQLKEKLEAGDKWQTWEGGPLVFTTPIGTPLDPSNVLKQFQSTLKVAGLPKLRFHDLRHSCATLLLAQGVSPRAIMEILGHTTITITMNSYTRVLTPTLRAAADSMDRLLTDGSQSQDEEPSPEQKREPVAVSVAVNAPSSYILNTRKN